MYRQKPGAGATEKGDVLAGDKPNHPGLQGYAKIVPHEEEVAGVCCQVVATNADGFNSNAVGLDASITALLVPDPSDHSTVFSQELTLPLGEVADCVGHQGFQMDTLLVRDQHPEMRAEEMLKHPTLWGVVGVPSGGVTSDDIPEGGVHPRRVARLLKAPVVALKRRV